jgi:hypothetical protein
MGTFMRQSTASSHGVLWIHLLLTMLPPSLYGLKQTPLGVVPAFRLLHLPSETSLFIYREGCDVAYLLQYVDTSSSLPPRPHHRVTSL